VNILIAVFNLVPALRDRIPGYFLGERLDEATGMAEQVLSSPGPMPPGEAISDSSHKFL